jgi:two-component system NtrC family sensor kinase
LFENVKNFFIDFYHSLSFKLFLILLFITLLFFGLYNTIYSTLQKNILEDAVRLSAYRVSDVVKKSLYRLMLINEREELYNTIQLLGNEPGMENIRIYNKKGEIKFSTKEKEIAQIVDMKAEACYECHAADKPIQSLAMPEKTRIYRSKDGRRIMGMINPIRNAPECSNAACHAHQTEKTILGVLDVQFSLNELDKATFKAKSITTVIFIGSVSLALIFVAIVVYIIIHIPIRNLKTGTALLAEGNLEHRIKMQRKDELGLLAQSINNMASNLKQAYTELKDWSNLLEERIKEKTIELEQMHHEMSQVEKMASLGKMAASVAHELNNPLAGIVTYARLLMRRVQKITGGDSEKNKILNELELIRTESLRCGNIVRNLLAFARGTSANFQESLLNDIIERALKIVHHHLELAKIEARIRVNIQPEIITCDPDQLLQALVALLVNAVEAMPDGGQLEIIAQNSPKDKEHLIIQIHDTGIGISDEVKDKILEPFFSTKKDETGVGLGLAVVYGIVQRHKGKIWVESQKDEGTTFFIELPFTQPNIE